MVAGAAPGRPGGAEIFLLRHGETEWNVEGRLQGCMDSPLTRQGRAQAAALGRLLGARFQGQATPPVHVSPLGRTRETAAIIGGHIGPAEVRIEPRLRELTLGSWEGLTQFDVDAQWPGLLDGATHGDWYFRSPDGERYDEAVARVTAWLEEIEGPVIAVSHGVSGRLIRGAYLGLPAAQALVLPTPQDVVWRLAGGRIEVLAA